MALAVSCSDVCNRTRAQPGGQPERKCDGSSRTVGERGTCSHVSRAIVGPGAQVVDPVGEMLVMERRYQKTVAHLGVERLPRGRVALLYLNGSGRQPRKLIRDLNRDLSRVRRILWQEHGLGRFV